jgi:hypothetical protein
MRELNWEIIVSNLTEAREQIEEIEKLATKEKRPSEVELQIMFEHAYHHLNFAWNIRHASTDDYANLSDAQFNKWSRFPKGLHESKIPRKS